MSEGKWYRKPPLPRHQRGHPRAPAGWADAITGLLGVDWKITPFRISIQLKSLLDKPPVQGLLESHIHKEFDLCQPDDNGKSVFVPTGAPDLVPKGNVITHAKQHATPPFSSTNKTPNRIELAPQCDISSVEEGNRAQRDLQDSTQELRVAAKCSLEVYFC
jgi:hypothetical protein